MISKDNVIWFDYCLVDGMVIVSKYMVPKGYSGISLFPFVFVKEKRLKSNSVFINHECIHLKQQLELLVLPFYLLYGFEFVLKLLKTKNWNIAYRSISFEREAYANEHDLNYLKNRPFWNFIRYF